MIQICLHLSLEAHHHKELIVLQHIVSSLEGLAPYCPSLAKFFRKMLFIKWHRNCKNYKQAVYYVTGAMDPTFARSL